MNVQHNEIISLILPSEDPKYQNVREMVQSGEIQVLYIESENNTDDVLTKPVAQEKQLNDETIKCENSPNKPTVPQEKIRPLTSLDHPQSPFYDPEGGSIKSVARVVLERIARKGEQCNIVPDNIDDIVADLAAEAPEDEGTF
uniref:Uncharacterized protein n=1 Tax=Sphaerodactylus townsendi TaxID=933632 RepID=A0ACB8G3C8_9SAUR